MGRSFQGLRSLDLERDNDVATERELGTLCTSAEGRGSVQRGIVANLRADNRTVEDLQSRRKRRLDVETQRERAVRGSPPAERDCRWIAVLELHEIESSGERSNKKSVVISPNLSPTDNFEPVVDCVAKVLRNTIAARIEPIITDVVQIRDESQLVVDLPHSRNVV